MTKNQLNSVRNHKTHKSFQIKSFQIPTLCKIQKNRPWPVARAEVTSSNLILTARVGHRAVPLLEQLLDKKWPAESGYFCGFTQWLACVQNSGLYGLVASEICIKFSGI
jgi:3',5'-cyclic AMP phosphodiesterase CpdA